MTYLQNLEKPVRKTVLLFLSSVAIFGIISIGLILFNPLDTTVEVMSIIGNIFLASGALASAYLASKSLAHRKSVAVHGVIVEKDEEVSIKVFNTGKNPILVTKASMVTIHNSEQETVCKYQELESTPILIEPEDSQTLMSCSGDVVVPLGVGYREFDNAYESFYPEYLDLEKDHTRFYVDGLQKEKLETVWNITNRTIFKSGKELLPDSKELFSVDENLVEMDDRELREKVEEAIDLDKISY
jgi:hypothetical protein